MKKELSVANKDIENQYVILKVKYYKGDTIDRVFKCLGGFGCHPECLGIAVMGEFVSDGESVRVGRGSIERFATDDEVDEAKKRLNEKLVQKQIEIQEKRMKPKIFRITLLDGTKKDLNFFWDPSVVVREAQRLDDLKECIFGNSNPSKVYATLLLDSIKNCLITDRIDILSISNIEIISTDKPDVSSNVQYLVTQ